MNESAALGGMQEIRLGEGSIRYREVGTGEPILLVKGFDRW